MDLKYFLIYIYIPTMQFSISLIKFSITMNYSKLHSTNSDNTPANFELFNSNTSSSSNQRTRIRVVILSLVFILLIAASAISTVVLVLQRSRRRRRRQQPGPGSQVEPGHLLGMQPHPVLGRVRVVTGGVPWCARRRRP